MNLIKYLAEGLVVIVVFWGFAVAASLIYEHYISDRHD